MIEDIRKTLWAAADELRKDAEAAWEQVRVIYEQGVQHLRSALQRFLQGESIGELLDRVLPALARLRARNWNPEVQVTRFENWLKTSASPRVDLVYANLFLHHFNSETLSTLLSQLARRTESVVLVEPRRSAAALLGARMLRWLGCNAVTRHDAVRSVHAGFRDLELSRAWPSDGHWILQEHAANLFSHIFVARRRESR